MKEIVKTTNIAYITDISWERIFLNLTIESSIDADLKFSLVRSSKVNEEDYIYDEDIVQYRIIEEHEIKYQKRDKNTYYFCLNMSTLDGRSFLDNGRWSFVFRDTYGKLAGVCSMTTAVAYSLAEKDKIYRYGRNGKYSYNVYFTTNCPDGETLIPVLNSRFMIMNPNWRNSYKISERKTVKGKFRCLLKKIKLGILNFIYSFLKMYHKKGKNRILFMTETKPYLWGNLKYINDRLIERGLDEQFVLDYSHRIAVGNNNNFFSWIKTINKVAKADYVFVDDFVPIFNFLKLDPHTQLIQVWHAGEGFKSVGYSRFGINGSPRPFGTGHKKYNYAITGSQRLVHIYSEVFGIPEDVILPLGMARLDGFLNPKVKRNKIEEVYSKYPQFKNKKIILFSPTFRGGSQKVAYYDYNQLNYKELYDLCGDEYIWAFKMHPFIKERPRIPKEYRDKLMDISEYENINDLYYITDVMVTDYSSAYYEFSLMDKPIVFFTYDREIYELTRGVHKPIKETAPGKVCDTFEEMIETIRKEDFDFDKTIQFKKENFGNYEGNAADKIIDYLLLSKKEK
ncbi:MAG: CDP-glycerol glycerophosphotransferase family protein [Mogibacterium sp.]|nr:CDP-glycerol glycerophosphotransferase family protein [Mogibacterium sp.]